MPGREYLALKDLHIAGDITIYHILDLKIKKEINKHSQLNVIGIITDKTKREFIEKLNCKSQICLSYGENQVLFKGILTQVEVTTHEGVHYVTLSALSDSYALDQKLKKRSFKRDEETYENVLREVGKDYRGFDFIGQKAVQNKLEGYLVQYEETDFEFIKRLASRINLPVIVEDTDNKPRFFIGLPQTDKITELKEEAYKETAYFREYETEFRGYILESPEFLNIGQTVSYRNRKLVVTRMTSQLIKGLLINQYEVLPSKKTKPISYFNTKIKGVSIKGEVTSVKETKVKVKLSIDTNQVENWYTYGTVMADAIYCMPYVGDQVKVHFLEKDERKALATLSVYEGVGLHPDTKFWSNKQGKKVEFTPSSLEFQAEKDILNNKELFMKMSHQEGLEIKSDHTITLACDGVLSLKAHTINMIAPEAVHLCTQANSRMVPLGINRKGLCLNPTSVNFETKRNAIIKGREKQSFPFEEEPRPTLRQKSSQVSLKPVPKALPKKKSKWGKFFKGLAIGVAAVAAVAVAVAVCVAAAPVVAGLLAGGTASILLGGAMAVGLAAGTATTAIGSGYMTAGAIDVMKGDDSENANQQVDKGLAFISSGFGIIMTTATFGMAAVPMAAYADNIMASYLDIRIVPGKGIYAKMPGKIIGTPSIDKQTTYTNPIMRADYMHTTTNDKYLGLKVVEGKVTGKIPIDDYQELRKLSIQNKEAESITLGKYRPTINVDGTENWKIPGPDSYNMIAKKDNSMYFDMGSTYDEAMKKYDLSYQEMFDYFNVPALDDAASTGKTIRFSHNPELPAYKGSFTELEWKYLQEKYDYLYLREEGGIWYAEK